VYFSAGEQAKAAVHRERFGVSPRVFNGDFKIKSLEVGTAVALDNV
jgi:hypothetical protein